MGKMTASDTKTKIEIKTNLAPPPEYRVIFINDSTTTVDFVVEILVSLFAYEVDNAKAITLKIHEDGAAVVAIMPYELAEQKALETTAIARSNGFPLSIKIEPVI
jgi:ATP-dependent Clp protease adaptor protein ClpS